MSDSTQREWRFYLDDFLGIDNDTLWSIIHSDVPALLPAMRALKNKSAR